MVKNQLFKTNPPEDLCLEVVKAFGLQGFDDVTNFSKKDLEVLGTVNKLYELKPKLEEYYIPCKAKLYVNNIDHKRAITILRQFLKTQNYTLSSKEKYIKGIKYNTYTVVSITNNLNINKNKERKIIINFE